MNEDALSALVDLAVTASVLAARPDPTGIDAGWARQPVKGALVKVCVVHMGGLTDVVF